MKGDWGRVGNDIAARLRAMRSDRVVTHTLAELLVLSGVDHPPDGYTSRSYWASCQRGDQYWDTLRRAGLVLSFYPDERGREVESVTFRLDGTQQA